ncbi:MAG: serine hydrolase, partial [Spirochaetales bacterium]|nr:serine hydrolase [Spirochaetales bacterium]
MAEKIHRIENGLQPTLQIEGDSIPKYNIEERMRELGIPGVSIAVVHNGEIEWARGYGMADSAENREVTVETLFLAGSISKPVAATRAHQLAELGAINLDSNVNNYLSGWKVPVNAITVQEKVTTRRILNHTAGLTVWGFPGYDKGDTIPGIIDVLDGKGNTDSVRVYKEPGESWMYSGGGYTVMQLMITDLEQKSFPEIMQTNVLDPLGMTSSTFENPLPEKYHHLAATGYRANGEEVEGKWPIYPEMAAAGLWTTPSQLILWAKEIQRILQNQENGLLTKETVNEMLTPGMNDHGLGPGVTEYAFGHGGADEGFRANLVAWKDTPHAVVVMVNSDNGSIIQEILLSIANEYGLPGIKPTIRMVKEQTGDE